MERMQSHVPSFAVMPPSFSSSSSSSTTLLSPSLSSTTPPRTPMSPAPMERAATNPLLLVDSLSSPPNQDHPLKTIQRIRNVVNCNVIGNQRTIRVFLSSAFGAMDVEREKFAEQYIPLLLLRCELLAVTLVIVNFRWGISEETERNERVLCTTLNAISQCDVFIGFYGQRYGWHDRGVYLPERNKGDELMRANIEFAIARGHGWVNDYRDRSVTELEYLAFSQHNPHAGPRLFLLRDKEYDDQKFTEAGDDPKEWKKFRTESDWASNRRSEFLQGIQGTVSEDCVVQYSQPEQAAEATYEFLKNVIRKRFGENPVSELMKMRCQHESFLASRTSVYIPNDELVQRVKLHVETCCSSSAATVPLALIGERGSGKSSFLANWLLQYARQHSEDIMIFHFIGASPESAEPWRILNRLIQELADLLNLDLRIPLELNDMKALLLDVLSLGSNRRRVVLVIDALDQLKMEGPNSNEPNLDWLPATFPPRVAVVLSSTPQPWLLQLVEKHQWSMVRVPKFQLTQERELIIRMLQARGRFFPEEYTDRILAAEQCQSPLFLCVLLDELCSVEVFGHLDAKIDHYLSAPDVVTLFDYILARIEEENSREHLARIASSLFCARYGLSENELLDFLQMEQTIFSPYYTALRRFSVNRAGLLVFFHQQFNQAVHSRYLGTPEVLKMKHQKLANYFFAHIGDEKMFLRVEQELCYHLEQAGDIEGLRRALQNLDLLAALQRDSNFELLRLWKITGDSVEKISGYFMDYMQDKTISVNHLAMIAAFLDDIGAYNESLLFYKRALQVGQSTTEGNHLDTVSTLNLMGVECRKQGKFQQAIKFHQRALRTLEGNPGPGNDVPLIHSMVNLAMAYQQKGAIEESLDYFQQALTKLDSIPGHNLNGDVEILNNMALAYLKMKDRLVEALDCYQRVLQLKETLVGARHSDFAVALQKVGNVLEKQGKVAEALKTQQRALHVLELVRGADSLEVADQLTKVADLFSANGKDFGAMQYLQRALTIRETVLGHESVVLADTLNRLGATAARVGDTEVAQRSLADCADIYAKLFGPDCELTRQTRKFSNLIAAQY